MVSRWGARALPYAGAAALVALTVVAATFLERVVPVTHVSILFIGAVLASAVLWGLAPALLAIVLGVAASSYFFYAPLFGAGAQAQEVVDIVLFVAMSLFVANLAARGRNRAIEARRSERRTKDLYAFSRRLAGIADPNDLYFAILDELGSLIDKPILLLLPGDEALIIFSAYLSDHPLSDAAQKEAERIWRAVEPDGVSLFKQEGEEWHFRVLRTGRGRVGLLAVRGEIVDSPHLASVLDQASIAIERTQLAAKIEDARVEERAEKLREALLNSISHDLQTPLSSIIGSATALHSFGALYDDAARSDLLATIREEGERLNHVIRNTLDLSRIRAGDIAPRLELVEPADIINAALRRAQRLLAGRSIQVEMPANLPMLRLDLFLMEQALVNLLENAIKYSAADTAVVLIARERGGEVEIDVADKGVGLAAAELTRVFDRFYRVTRPDAAPAGTGLGLAIARAFVDANGGRIQALSAGPGTGTTFRVVLPVPEDTGDDSDDRHDEAR
jgi:two-component system sensor histidine kinase KdpD